MTTRFFAFLLMLLPYVCLHAGWWDNVKTVFIKQQQTTPPKIKVLIVDNQDGVVVEVKGKYAIYDPHTDEHISSRYVGKRKFMQALNDGLKWDEEFPGIHQLAIVPEDKVTTVVNGLEYLGSIYVYDIGGTISIVNEISVEDYLKSILSLQFKDPLPHEALAAVAIAARTNVYYQVEKPKSIYWAIDGRKAGYEGSSAMIDNTPIEQAIEDTRYMALTMLQGNGVDLVSFAAQWGPTTGGKIGNDNTMFSRISLFEAGELAAKGDNAAQILSKAFPNTKILVVKYKTE